MRHKDENKIHRRLPSSSAALPVHHCTPWNIQAKNIPVVTEDEIRNKIRIMVNYHINVFEATNKYITWQKVQIVELGKKLNRALANKTAELFKVRSSFFESLSKAVAGNKNFIITGDRFIIPSEVFFKSNSADIGLLGKKKLKDIAVILKQAMKSFPDDIDWILRIDGHTDSAPIKENSKYNSNWELSVARAVSVVNFLISEGIPENHLAATGFGEFHPIVKSSNIKDMQKNRRIEFKLTEK